MEFGIKVVVIAPGLIKTEFVPNQLRLLNTIAHPPAYEKLVAGVHQLLAARTRDARTGNYRSGRARCHHNLNSAVTACAAARLQDGRGSQVAAGSAFFAWAVAASR